jgi:hypothetical protein
LSIRCKQTAAKKEKYSKISHVTKITQESDNSCVKKEKKALLFKNALNAV